MRRVYLILAALITVAVVTGCGASKHPPRSNISGCHGCRRTSRALVGSGSAPQVGAPTPAGVVCDETLGPGANVGSAVSSASAGSVVCLSSGSWSAITLENVSPASAGVTLAAAPGQTVVVPGITVQSSQNLTVEGFSVTQPGNGDDNGIQLFCGLSNVTLKYNTIEDQPGGYGVYAAANYCGAGPIQNDINVEYNQIDHVGAGIQVNGGMAYQTNWTISHNVIGPEISYGNTSSQSGGGHYIEIGGANGATVDNNAFEGPEDSNATTLGEHVNVLHLQGGQENITFDNNIMWHTDTRGESVLFEDSPMDNIQIENNLDIEDPACVANTNCNDAPFDISAPDGLAFEHNTAVDGAWGIVHGQVTGTSSNDPENMTAQDNIDVGTPASGQANYGLWDCNSSCAVQDNVSQDTSANSKFGGTGNVVNWNPTWTTTNWTPVDGPGYQPPPTGYYQPTSLSITNAGYQNNDGP